MVIHRYCAPVQLTRHYLLTTGSNNPSSFIHATCLRPLGNATAICSVVNSSSHMIHPPAYSPRTTAYTAAVMCSVETLPGKRCVMYPRRRLVHPFLGAHQNAWVGGVLSRRPRWWCSQKSHAEYATPSRSKSSGIAKQTQVGNIAESW